MRQKIAALVLLILACLLAACAETPPQTEAAAAPTTSEPAATLTLTLTPSPVSTITPTITLTPTESLPQPPTTGENYYTEYRNGVAVNVDQNTEKIAEYYDEAEGVWKSAAFELSQRYPSGFSEKYTSNVGGVEFSFDFGLGKNVVYRDELPISEVHIAEDMVSYFADYLMHAFYYHYTELMGNDVTYEEYLDLVGQGKGQIEIAAYNEVTGKTLNDVEVQMADPSEGVALTFTDRDWRNPLPIDYKGIWAGYVGVDGRGKLLLAIDLMTIDNIKLFYGVKEYGEDINGELLILTLMQSMAGLVGEKSNMCIIAENIARFDCTNNTAREKMQEYYQPINDEVLAHYNGKRGPLIIVERQ